MRFLDSWPWWRQRWERGQGPCVVAETPACGGRGGRAAELVNADFDAGTCFVAFRPSCIVTVFRFEYPNSDRIVGNAAVSRIKRPSPAIYRIHHDDSSTEFDGRTSFLLACSIENFALSRAKSFHPPPQSRLFASFRILRRILATRSLVKWNKLLLWKWWWISSFGISFVFLFFSFFILHSLRLYFSHFSFPFLRPRRSMIGICDRSSNWKWIG